MDRKKNRTYYSERASALDFKDAAAPRFGHSDVACCLFLVTNIKKVLPVNHQQKCLINVICGVFLIKSNYFGSMIPKKLKSFENLDKRAIKCEKRVFILVDQKLWPNLGVEASLKPKADALPR